jgi:hypothetical protein
MYNSFILTVLSNLLFVVIYLQMVNTGGSKFLRLFILERGSSCVMTLCYGNFSMLYLQTKEYEK